MRERLSREVLNILSDEFERRTKNGEYFPIEVSIEELLDIANSYGYLARGIPETDEHYGIYAVRSGEHTLRLRVKADKPVNDKAVWVPTEELDLFKSLFLNRREGAVDEND